MPGRLRQTTSQTLSTTQQRVYGISGLEFDEALTWRAGKAIGVADLLSRLQKLAAELKGLEQGHLSAKDVQRLAQDLAHANLLGHKDKGIRAFTLCCIVDILTICAPDAPFGPAQLKDIFTVIVNTILPALADPSNAYNAQHVYILTSLTDTKSIVLITDLENSETLIVPLFTICFDIVSGAGQSANGMDVAKSVEFQLRTLLVTIIDEITLPQDATDIILSQFLRVDPQITNDQQPRSRKDKEARDKRQDTLHLKDYPPAYNMAKSICTTCPDKMSAQVTQYFGTIIMNASASLENNDAANHVGRKASELDEIVEDDESLEDLRKAHRLARELWKACPDVLPSVIPQLESELAADSVSLRQLATETLGDMIAGIGVAGLPSVSGLDPAAYPLPSILEPQPTPLGTNPLLVPASPKPFGSIHISAYHAFMSRQRDKAPSVRMAWVTAASRILLTDAGGIGISTEDQTHILAGCARMLEDTDDKVRQSVIQCASHFGYHAIIDILASDGGLSSSTSFMSVLANRVTDRKQNVREVAMRFLGRLWGVGSRDIEAGVERVVAAIAGIPNNVFKAMLVKDLHSQAVFDQCLYEDLLPISFPPAKPGKGDSQKSRKQDKSTSEVDLDHVRVLRILTLVDSLDEKTKIIFFALQKRQTDLSKALGVFLTTCEEYNGGVVDDRSQEQRLKEALTRYISQISKQFPEPSKASSDLWKFARQHDRRNYQLVRFVTGTEHDYKTMYKAVKELTKRLKESGSSAGLLDTLQPLLYRCALMVYNRSHVPAIMEISRTNKSGLSAAAHEVLKNIAEQNPAVLKSHIQTLCQELESTAPTSTRHESASAADMLKACSDFARKYPGDVPKERKFLAAMTSYALHAYSPRAAKHAVTIVLTVSDKKELHAKEIVTTTVKNCKPSLPAYTARLAAIAQVCLLAPAAAAAVETAISKIALEDCLQQNRIARHDGSVGAEAKSSNAWETIPSDYTTVKVLALKILVNRCRASSPQDDLEAFDVLTRSVLDVLMKLIRDDGEMTLSKDTSPALRNHLRAAAAHFILKLCAHERRCEELVTPQMFIQVALIVINPPIAVRTALVHQLQKYLGRGKLHQRWYTPLFLLAFEPDTKLQSGTLAWLRSRMQRQSKQKLSHTTDDVKVSSSGKGMVLESTFSRLISLLAHHPDYPDNEDPEINFDGELLDFSRYIVFYLQAVATEENISLIFHIAQRVKQTRDGVTGSDKASQAIYVLSDLSQAVIRNFADLMPASTRGNNLLQTYPGRVSLPANLYAALSSHAEAQAIASKNYLPEEVATRLDELVRTVVKGKKSHTARRPAADKKRKSDSANLDSDDGDDNDDDHHRRKSAKKPKKSSTLPIRKTPQSSKRKAETETASEDRPSRKSARTSTVKQGGYAESDDEDMRDMVSSPIKPKSRKSESTIAVAEVGDIDEEAAAGHENGSQHNTSNEIPDAGDAEVEVEDELEVQAGDDQTLENDDNDDDGDDDKENEEATVATEKAVNGKAHPKPPPANTDGAADQDTLLPDNKETTPSRARRGGGRPAKTITGSGKQQSVTVTATAVKKSKKQDANVNVQEPAVVVVSTRRSTRRGAGA